MWILTRTGLQTCVTPGQFNCVFQVIVLSVVHVETTFTSDPTSLQGYFVFLFWFRGPDRPLGSRDQRHFNVP